MKIMRTILTVILAFSTLLCAGGAFDRANAWSCDDYRQAFMEDAYKHSIAITVGNTVSGCLTNTEYGITSGDRGPMYNITTSNNTNVKHRFTVTNDSGEMMNLEIYHKDLEAAEWKYVDYMSINTGFTKSEDFSLKPNGIYFIGLSDGGLNGEFSLRVTEVPYEVVEKNHDYTNWVLISNPSCTEAGLMQRECKNCKQKDTASISALGHKWNEKYTIDRKATYAKKGSKSIHCSVCNAIKEDSVVSLPKLTVKATALPKVSASKKGFIVKWKKGKVISGYQIQYANNKRFKKGKKITIKKKTTVSKKVKKLKARKKYYVRIRTFKTVNGKRYYSKWSKVKTVTTKK